MTTNKFKNEMGVLYLKALFFEQVNADKSTVVYTLKNEDHTVDGITYPSLYKLYMSVGDPTEYRFAINHLDSWDHWERLCECSWFKPYVEKWRRELDLKIKSESLARITAMSKVPSKEQFMANRYMLEKGWVPKEEQSKAQRGRPSKAEIKEAANDLVSTHSRTLTDLERLGITVKN